MNLISYGLMPIRIGNKLRIFKIICSVKRIKKKRLEN